MATLSVSDASRMAGVSIESMVDKINRGELRQSDKGIEVSELIREYPNLKPLASLKIRKVKETPVKVESFENIGSAHENHASVEVIDSAVLSSTVSHNNSSTQTLDQKAEQSVSNSGTVELLVRELEWNKELLEKTNQLMAKQLAEQRALIADQARRLDEKDRFWARQIEIAQSLLPAPEAVPAPRKKFLGIF